MARNDAVKVPLDALAQIRPSATPRAMQEWLRGQIAGGSVDRNTRSQIAASEGQTTDYVQRLLTEAAYQSDTISDFRQDPRTPATTRELIDAGVPSLIAMRAKSQPELAAAVGEMLTRVIDYTRQGETKLDDALRRVFAQEESRETEAGKTARNLAYALAAQVERLPANKRGERKIDPEETASNFHSFFERLATSIRNTSPEEDMFGGVRTVNQVVRDFIRSTVGDKVALVQEPGKAYAIREPDPRVKRLNALQAKLRKQGSLSPAEETERRALEGALGQDFMGFFNQEQARQDGAAEAERRKLEMEAKAKQRLTAAQIETQLDIFRKPQEEGGQLTLMERQRRLGKREKRSAKQLEFEFQAQITSAITGARDLQSLRGGMRHGGANGALSPVHLYATAVAEHLIRFGTVDVVGQTIRNTDEAAVLFQTFRQPQFEVGHWVFTRGNVVVGRYSVTASTPNTAYLHLPTDTLNSMNEMRRSLGADGYWLVHNHPSGNPEPSITDIRTTRAVRQTVPGFLGHIIINHRNYAVINARDESHIRPVPGNTWLADPYVSERSGQKLGHLLGRTLEMSSDSIAGFAKELQGASEDLISLLFVDARGTVRGLGDVSVQDFVGNSDLPTHIRDAARSQGASAVFAYYHGSPGTAVERNILNQASGWIRSGLIWDLITNLKVRPKALSERTGAPPTDGWMGLNPWKSGGVVRLAEEDRHASSGLYTDTGPGKTGRVPVKLGGLNVVRPADMPELVRLVKEWTGEVPSIRKLPSARGLFKPMGAGMIKLDPAIFKDPVAAAKTLAHEIGHLIDYLPDRTMARGNLLGRLAVLRRYLLTTLPDSPHNPNKALSPKDRAAIRRQAEKNIGPGPSKAIDEVGHAQWQAAISEEYHNLIEQEIHEMVFEQVDFIDVEKAAMSFGQEAGLKGLFALGEGALKIE
jgi:hypothetical protein